MRKFKACYAKQYQDAQGQPKTSWKTLGFANEVTSQEGKVTIHLSLDAVPTGQWDGELKLFLQEEQQQGNQAPQQSYQQPEQRPQQSYGKDAPVHYEQAPQGQRR